MHTTGVIASMLSFVVSDFSSEWRSSRISLQVAQVSSSLRPLVIFTIFAAAAILLKAPTGFKTEGKDSRIDGLFFWWVVAVAATARTVTRRRILRSIASDGYTVVTTSQLLDEDNGAGLRSTNLYTNLIKKVSQWRKKLIYDIINYGSIEEL